jgi:hypothetical protein
MMVVVVVVKSLYSGKHHAMKMGGGEDAAPRILNIGTRSDGW